MVRRVHALVGPVVLKNGSEPKSRDAKLLEIVEMLAYALKVAAMSERRLRAIAQLVAHAFHHVVFRIAVGETVGHEQIEHVGIGEALTCLACLLTLLELIFNLLPVEPQRHLASFGVLEVEINEKIVGRVEAYHGVDLCPWIISSDVAHVAYTLAIEHYLERRVFHAREPIDGINTQGCGCVHHGHGKNE